MTLAMQLVEQHIRDCHPGATVTHKVPTKRPRAFIRLDQAPASRLDIVIDRTLVIIQVYAPNLRDAFEMAEHLRATMDTIDLERDEVLGWNEQAGPQEYPDPDLRDTARVQMTGYLLHDNRN